jgi:PIN domain nuclease of toxin-antitoxin system
MRVLLDTHVLLWAPAEPRRLDAEDPSHDRKRRRRDAVQRRLFGRSASKAALGRAGFAFDPEEIARAALETGFIELAVRWNAAALVARLPLLHRDPFDRVLVAQAIVEPATLYTADPQLVPCSELVRRIGTFQPTHSRGDADAT